MEPDYTSSMESEISSDSSDFLQKVRTVSPKELFLTFSVLSLYGFGGVMPWVYHTVVEKKKWLDSRGFAELLAVGQIIPGANVTNFCAMLGYRFAGGREAFAAVSGLLSLPFVLIIGIGILYQKFGNIPAVQGGLRGVTAVAAGLVIVTGVKLLRGQTQSFRTLLIGGAALLGIGVFGWPLLWVILGVGTFAIVTEWRLVK